MNIIFIRHGKAEERSLTGDEKMRDLTEKGKKILNKDLKYLATYLAKKSEVTIWTSQLPRAVQTAEILAQYLEQAKIEQHEFLYEDDLEILKLKLMAGQKDFLVIVGHNPYFEIWVSQLIGREVGFKKGEAIEVVVTDIPLWQGQLVKDFKPKAFHEIND